MPAGEHFDTTFVVTDDRPCVITGRVLGVDGGNRDLDVLVLDRDGFTNWHNGTDGSALFVSRRASAATLNVPLPGPGEYSLLISNRFSVLTGKTVNIPDARITCG